MASGETEDRGLDSFLRWQYGVFLLVVMGVAAGAVTILLQLLSVPYADIFGVLLGPVAAFLAVSYLYYGR